MKGTIKERASIGAKIQDDLKYAYSLVVQDMQELYDYGSKFEMIEDAYNAGFYAGIRCAINRGFSKNSAPVKALRLS